MSIIFFVDSIITTSFMFSPAISRYMISKYYFLDYDIVFLLVQGLIVCFIFGIVFGGVLGSDMGVPVFSVMYPVFLLLYNSIFYLKYHNFHRVLAISLVAVFLLNATHEVNFFVYEILYGAWIPANLLFGIFPMHLVIWIYTIITGVWFFQLAKIKFMMGPIMTLSFLLLVSFIPDSFGVFSTSVSHHIFVSTIQFVLFVILILGWNGLKTEKQVIADVS